MKDILVNSKSNVTSHSYNVMSKAAFFGTTPHGEPAALTLTAEEEDHLKFSAITSAMYVVRSSHSPIRPPHLHAG